MGLFSKKPKPTVVEREYQYNVDKLKASIERMGGSLLSSRKLEGHSTLKDMVSKMLNVEILYFSSHNPQKSAEEYAYKRGRIDALRSILVEEERLVNTAKKKMASKEKEAGAEKKTKYVRPSRGVAGLA